MGIAASAIRQRSAAELFLFAALCCCEKPSAAQEHTWKQNATIGAGVAIPGADMRPFMSSAFLFRVNYAYRFHRFLQAETGIDAISGAAGVNRVEDSAVGDIRIRDNEYVVPFGVRAILPLSRGRFELSTGGGGAYIFYSEEADAPEGVNVYCPFGGCAVIVDCNHCNSRSGWGYYAIAGAALALDARRRTWLGFTGRFVRGTTSGQTLGRVPGLSTADQWLGAAVELNYRF